MRLEIGRRMAWTGLVDEPVRTTPTPVKVGDEIGVKATGEEFTDGPRRRPYLTGLVRIARQVSARRLRLLLAPEIGASAGLNKDTAARALAALAGAGIVARERAEVAGARRRSGYRLRLPAGIGMCPTDPDGTLPSSDPDTGTFPSGSDAGMGPGNPDGGTRPMSPGSWFVRVRLSQECVRVPRTTGRVASTGTATLGPVTTVTPTRPEMCQRIPTCRRLVPVRPASVMLATAPAAMDPRAR